jgi:hypothetical protein
MPPQAYLYTLALWQTDPWLFAANDENVAFTGSKRIVNGVLNVHDVETTIVTFSVCDNTNTTHVTTTSHHGDDSSVEFDEVGDLSGSEVDLDRVVDLDGWVGVSDPIIMPPSALFSSPKLDPTSERCGKLTFGHHA